MSAKPLMSTLPSQQSARVRWRARRARTTRGVSWTRQAHDARNEYSRLTTRTGIALPAAAPVKVTKSFCSAQTSF